MKTSILFILFSFASYCAYCQDIWAAISTSDATAESMDLVMDAAGNSYIAGYISGDTEFQDIQLDLNNGYSDVIVAKINPEGVYQWVKRFSGPLSDKGVKIALTSTNELIISGTFYNSITFGSTTLTAVNGSKDIFLARLSNSGDVIWARKDGGSLGDNIYGLTLDQADNIILTGQFEGTSTIANQTFSSMTDPETNLPSFDMFLAKYSSSGSPIWAKAAYAEYEDRGLAVVCDNQNNIYLTGQFSDTINYFGQTINNQIYNAGFVSKFDGSGNNLWFDKLAGAQVLAYDLAINHQNQLLVTGDYIGQMVVWAQENQHVLTNPYEKKIFLLKFSLNGNYVWGKAIGSDSEVSSRALCVDDQDNIYIGGHFRCNFDEYRDSTGTAHWQSAGFRDQFVSKFTTSGTLIWKNQVGGQRQDQCWGIAIRENDYPVICGSYTTNLVFPFDWLYGIGGHISNSGETTYDQESIDPVSYAIIEGDESVNIHVSKMINPHSVYYNYYEYSPGPEFNDSVPMSIYPGSDTVHFCPGQVAHVEAHSNYKVGPIYSGQWSNGQFWSSNLDVNNTDGQYTVHTGRVDGCSDYDDTLYIDYHPSPTLPLLTDDHGVNTSTQLYTAINACSPDTLNFHFANLCAGCSAEIVFTPFHPYNEPLVIDSNYQTSVDSYIHVEVTSPNGCTKTRAFSYSLMKDIKPYLLLTDYYDRNDSIMICEGQFVEVIIADSLTNPSRLFISHEENPSAYSVVVTHQGQPISQTGTTGHYSSFQPSNTGWYLVTQNLTVGMNSCLYPHQTQDSFYVEIKDKPDVAFFGGGLLCPDTYNYLSVSPVIPGLAWSGAGILWTSADKDSIMLNESGSYSVSGDYNYGEVSCPFSAYIQIFEKQPPLILLNPADGIVCPGDSVLLSLNQEGLAYEWIGPEGDLVSEDSAIYAVDQGFYACIFTDQDGCKLLTAQAEIREYTTPFIELSPVDFMCGSEPITLTAIYGGMANLHWQSPLNSNTSSVVVNQPGTYSCEITQCGLTVRDSVTIIDASYELEISSESTIMCIGDTLTLSTTPGLATYQWSNGFAGLSFFEASSPGTYSVQTWNNYGCMMLSDTITITAYPESFPPAINDTFVCLGGNIDLVYNSELNFGWYHLPGDALPFSTQDTIGFINLLSDTVVYVAHNSTNCPLNFTEVLIEALLPLNPPEILGDTTICIGDVAAFEVEPIVNGSYFWIYDGDTISTQHTVTVPGITSDSPLVFHIALTDGCTENENEISMSVKLPSPISINIISDTLCYGETLFANASGIGNVQFTWSDGISTWSGSDLAVNYFDLSSESVSVYGTNADDCQSEILSLEVTKSPDADLQLSLDTATCLGNKLTISAIDTLGPISWLLPDGSSENGFELHLESLVKEDAGLYVATWVNDFNCPVSDSLTIDMHDLPFFKLGRDSVLCADKVYNLTMPEIDGYTFSWGNGSTEAVFTPNGEPVILTAVDSNFCRFSDTTYILLVDCSGRAPNVITANGDGINEYFTVFNSEYEYDNCLLILDRWGNVVYEQQYYQNLFNGYTNKGEKLSDGVYFFLYYSNCSLKKEITHQGFFHIISE
ncbi:MAG: gliding motility-associated C-terminal domain-containing protein [Bacteroidota bacterium]